MNNDPDAAELESRRELSDAYYDDPTWRHRDGQLVPSELKEQLEIREARLHQSTRQRAVSLPDELLTQSEKDAKVKSPPNFEPQPAPTRYKPHVTDPDKPLGSWGNPYKKHLTEHVIASLTAIDTAIRFNTRDDWFEYKYLANPWKRIDFKIAALYRNKLAKDFYYYPDGKRQPMPYRLSATEWKDAIGALCGARSSANVDPFLEWLDSIVHLWDGHPRVESFLSETLGANDTPLTQWASRYLFVAPIERAVHPGAKQDEIPILVGSQGIGKSHLLSSMFLPKHQTWFTDSVRIGARTEQRVEAMQGKVIAEIAEMHGSRTASLEDIKGFISRQFDSVRLAYRTDPEPYPRKVALVGTADNDSFLPNDAAGLRRFVPIQCHKGMDVKRYLDQKLPVEERLGTIGEPTGKTTEITRRVLLWSEAYQSFEVNPKFETARLPRNLHDNQREIANSFRDSDSALEEGLLAKNLTRGCGLSLQELAEAFNFTDDGKPVSRRDQKRLVTALKVTNHHSVHCATGNIWIQRDT